MKNKQLHFSLLPLLFFGTQALTLSSAHAQQIQTNSGSIAPASDKLFQVREFTCEVMMWDFESPLQIEMAIRDIKKYGASKSGKVFKVFQINLDNLILYSSYNRQVKLKSVQRNDQFIQIEIQSPDDWQALQFNLYKEAELRIVKRDLNESQLERKQEAARANVSNLVFNYVSKFFNGTVSADEARVLESKMIHTIFVDPLFQTNPALYLRTWKQYLANLRQQYPTSPVNQSMAMLFLTSLDSQGRLEEFAEGVKLSNYVARSGNEELISLKWSAELKRAINTTVEYGVMRTGDWSLFNKKEAQRSAAAAESIILEMILPSAEFQKNPGLFLENFAKNNSYLNPKDSARAVKAITWLLDTDREIFAAIRAAQLIEPVAETTDLVTTETSIESQSRFTKIQRDLAISKIEYPEIFEQIRYLGLDISKIARQIKAVEDNTEVRNALAAKDSARITSAVTKLQSKIESDQTTSYSLELMRIVENREGLNTYDLMNVENKKKANEILSIYQNYLVVLIKRHHTNMELLAKLLDSNKGTTDQNSP